MHYLPDTNDEDAIQERYWPDNFKLVIRNEIKLTASFKFTAANLKHIYKQHYSQFFSEIQLFCDAVINSIVVGAENGVDIGFDSVYSAFLKEIPLPEMFQYHRSLWPTLVNADINKKIHQAIAMDYYTDDGFRYAYKDGYKNDYVNYSTFINIIADILIISMSNQIDDTLQKLYAAFVYGYPLPPFRRNPKRLKTW